MPGLNDGELSRRDKGIRTAEICPNCFSTEIDVEPAYRNGEIYGTRYLCRECGWCEDFEEGSPEDVGESHSQVEREIITVDSVTGWHEAFKEAAVEELQGTSELDEADRENIESKIETLDQLIDFFKNSSEKTDTTGETQST